MIFDDFDTFRALNFDYLTLSSKNMFSRDCFSLAKPLLWLQTLLICGKKNKTTFTRWDWLELFSIFYFLFSNSLTFQIFSSFFLIEDLWRLLDFYYLWISVDYECKILTKTKQNRNVCSMQIYEREKEIRSAACIWFPGLGDSVPKSS